jgi:hypothetical protein
MPKNIQKLVPTEHTGRDGAISAVTHVAKAYEAERFLVVHSHGSMHPGEELCLSDQCVLTYTNPGEPIKDVETRLLLEAMDNEGRVLDKVNHVKIGRDLALRMNTDVSPNYHIMFLGDDDGYAKNTTFPLGYYIFDPKAAVAEKLDY